MRKGDHHISGMKRLLCTCVMVMGLFVMGYNGYAQVAGMSTLAGLDMSTSARTAALGMDYLAVFDDDFNVGINNPSLLDERCHNALMFNYVGLFRGVNMGSASYGFHSEKAGTFMFGMNFTSYGHFEGYDENEMPTGRFSAADYMLSVGWGRKLNDNFSVGVNFKPIVSHYENYTAIALAVDVAGSYVSNSKQFATTLIARNIGAQVMTFDGKRESLPFELSAALSYKLKKAPFRFFFALTELQKWNLRYKDPMNPTESEDPFTGEVIRQSKFAGVMDNMFRHTLFGLELNLGKSFYARVGYSYRQTKENQTTALQVLNMSGFSYGFGFRIKGIDIAYSRNNYHLGQAPNFISITTNLNRFVK